MKKRRSTLLCLLLAGGMGTMSSLADNVYTIYPIPQEQIAVDGQVSFTSTVNVVYDTDDIDEYTLDWLSDVLAEHGITATYSDAAVSGQTNVFLGVAGSGGPADTKATELGIDRSVLTQEGKYDRHIVSLSADGSDALLLILGENTDATFYGISSLAQMLDNGVENLPCVTINDYADQQSRGLVEGYYGYPYSLAVKKDLMQFMARYKLNTYLYGAKSDPYHSGYYLDPYPTEITEEQERNGWLTQDMFKELTSTAHATKVNFIWAIHPGLNTTTDAHVTDIMGKFELMYDLGVRQFAVFTDDVGGYGDESDFPLYAQFFTNLQNQIDAKWNTEGAAPADTVKPLHYVPHVYNLTWTSTSNRQAYFAALSAIPEKIVFYTTGYGVWTVPNNSDLQTMDDEFGRDVAWWWNYPCNDNADTQIYPSDMYQNFVDMPAVTSSSTLPSSLENCAGLLCNPMQQGEIAKIPLFSLADYAWNNGGFDNMSSWEAAVPAAVGDEYADAVMSLAPYLRYNEADDVTSLISTYKTKISNGSEADATELSAKMDEIITACDKVAEMETSSVEADQLFYNDVYPWLNRVHDLATTVKDFLTAKEKTVLAEQWDAYLSAIYTLDSLESSDRYTVQALEGMGVDPPVGTYEAEASANTFTPFATEWLAANAFGDMFPERETIESPAFYSTLTESPTVRMFDSQLGVYGSGIVQVPAGEMAGIQLIAPTRIDGLTVADTLYDNFEVRWSQNGKTWNSLPKGDLPEEACRYICLRNTSGEARYIRFNRLSFCINIPQSAVVTTANIPDGEVWNGHTSDLIYDGDYTTFCTLNQNQANNDAYELVLRNAIPIHDVRVCMGTTNDDYMNVGVVQISMDGSQWTSLKIMGTNSVNFTMSNSKVVKYSDEMSYCDFEADGDSAKYVRLLVRQANTSKWLRLYEIEVNKLYDLYGELPTATDDDGDIVTEVFDNDPSTYFSSSSEGTLTYNLLNPKLVDNISVFIDSSQAYDETTVSATCDGENWIELGTITGSVTQFSLEEADCTNAIAIRFEWSGASPAIHEICEEASSTLITGIDNVTETTDSENGIELTRSGGRLSVQSPTGISRVTVYTLDGRVLTTIRPAGENCVTIPRMQADIVLVNVLTCDNRTASYKVRVR